jgi:hypothetical protein
MGFLELVTALHEIVLVSHVLVLFQLFFEAVE